MKYRKAKHVLASVRALDVEVERAIEAARAREAERDAEREKLAAAVAAQAPFAEALNEAEAMLAAAQERKDRAHEAYAARGIDVVHAQRAIAERTAEMEKARAEAERLAATRRNMDADVAEATERVEKSKAEAQALAAHPKGCRCEPCLAPKPVNVSPLKIAIGKTIAGVGYDVQEAKREQTNKAITMAREHYEKEHGVTISGKIADAKEGS
jgi:hypothetical protein